MRHLYLATFLACVLAVSILGRRGARFTAPPLDVFPEWLFPGMKYQPRLRPQGDSSFFADGRADRVPPDGTVARGQLREDEHLFRGRTADGEWARALPAGLNVDLQFVGRGRDQFLIYCAPCHGQTGDGNGITKRYGIGTTPTFHDDARRKLTDGEIFNTITNGTQNQNMKSYADTLEPEDRWAVVAYVRALQRARQGVVNDVTDPAARRSLGLP